MKVPNCNNFGFYYMVDVPVGTVFQFCDEINKYYIAILRYGEEGNTFYGYVDLSTGECFDVNMECAERRVKLFDNAELILKNG